MSPVIRLKHCTCGGVVNPDSVCSCGQPHGKARRGEYATAAWSRLRCAAIAAHPWCSECNTTTDLTGDHLRYPARTVDDVRVLCRPCNSRSASLTLGGGGNRS